jgi:hypothetical protein
MPTLHVAALRTGPGPGSDFDAQGTDRWNLLDELRALRDILEFPRAMRARGQGYLDCLIDLLRPLTVRSGMSCFAPGPFLLRLGLLEILPPPEGAVER